MFSLLHRVGWSRDFAVEFPSFAVAWVLAELFYKFHSFSIECAAFLATWYCLSGLVSLAVPTIEPRRKAVRARDDFFSQE